ncbi:MAG: hypothetical protein AAF601_06060 [Pseudomonadota bacterium]
MSSRRAPADALSRFDCDRFERGVLIVARHFAAAFADPASFGWQKAYNVAADRWGDTLGLPVAHQMSKVMRAVVACRGDSLQISPPTGRETLGVVTDDEAMLIEMLHHMRRNNARAAREVASVLTHGTLDPEVIRAGLSFADRFAAGAPPQTRGRPALAVVA